MCRPVLASRTAAGLRFAVCAVAIAVAAVLAVAVAVLAVLFATPASAHGRGSDATDFRSSVVAQPQAPDVHWRVYGADEFLSVENGADEELIVEGYQGEPYLRVGPEGVFVNQNSEATYLNAERFANVVPPPNARADAQPDWQQVSDATSWLWHDHRIHWMSPAPPPQVQGQEGRVLVQPWTVPFRVADRRYEVAGELWWEPGPSPWPWLLGALVLTAPALAGLRRGGRGDNDPRGREGRWQSMTRPPAAVLGVVALLNLTHLLDDLLAVPLPGPTKALAALQTTMFIAVGLFGALRAWQGGEGAFTALGVGAGAILVGQGLLYVPVLGSSQTASVFPDWLARGVVSLSLAQCLPVGTVAVVGTRLLGLPAVRATDEGDRVQT